MKVLLTGSKGFIGKNFINKLDKQNVSYVEYDLIDGYKDPNQLNFEDVTKCIHLGAHSSTTDTNIKRVLDNNLTWSIMLFEECVKRQIDFQWSSSASVYGQRTKEQGPFCVGDPCYPANIYGQSKLLLETYIMNRSVAISKQGFRYFNVYGEYENHKGAQASPYHQFEKQAKETGTIRIFEGSENYIRDFVPVDKVIDTHLHFINKSLSFICNVGTGKPKSFLEVAREIAEKYNAKIETIPFPENLKSHYQIYTCAELNDENSYC
jgi:ADP-L-glycero-D-manno-heptose 6-epimerase